MSAQSNSSNTSAARRIPSCCRCGLVAPLKTALTQANTGRRFYGCVNYERGRGCGFFRWVDTATPDHLKALLYEMPVENEEYKRKYLAYVSERGDLQRAVISKLGFVSKMWIVVAGAFVLYFIFVA